MGKRSDGTFERSPRDHYPTPLAAVGPLLRHLPPGSSFVEPCAGEGLLVGHLAAAGHPCIFAGDIEPLDPSVMQFDLLKDPLTPLANRTVITNPPWDRKILHPMISRMLPHVREMWLLFDSDWMHTVQSHELIKYCSDIVSVGRVKWIPDSPTVGKDNAAWHRFSRRPVGTTFHGRIKKVFT